MSGPRVLVELREADRQWVVRRPSARRVTSVHSSLSAAERAARLLGQRQRCDVVVIVGPGNERRYDYADVPRNGSRLHRPPQDRL
jgi:hypothetical protein